MDTYGNRGRVRLPTCPPLEADVTEVVVRVLLDPRARVQVERYTDIADRPIVVVRDVEGEPAPVGEAVLAVLRAVAGVDGAA